MLVHIDRSLRLPATEYVPGPERKSRIALHHTVGSGARSILDRWMRTRTVGGCPQLAGTAELCKLRTAVGRSIKLIADGESGVRARRGHP